MLVKNILNTTVTFCRRYSQTANKELVLEHLKGQHVGITVFGLNKVEQRNAISMSLLDHLLKAVDKIPFENNTKVLIIRSLVPGAFCAGADLKERAEMNPKEVNTFVVNIRNLIYKIYNLSIPVIASIDGVALGGGLEMALASDIRIASSNAKLGLVETKLAIMPGAGGTQLLPRIVGPAIAKELIFTAKIFDGYSAEKMGIVNHTVEQNENGNAAYLKSLELAGEILPNGPLGVKMAKKAVNKGVEVDFGTGLAIEEACYNQLIPTKDRTEGLQAFKEKRKPLYQGH